MKNLMKFAMAICICSALNVKADSATKVLIIGDSMMKLPAHALELALSRQNDIITKSFTSIGSGLARLDVFDWIEKAESLVEEFNPDVTLVWFGANDRQPMQMPGERVVQIDDPEWETEYSRRVGKLMDLLTVMDKARVIWLELPDMRDPKPQENIILINRLVQAEASKRSQAEIFPARQILGRTPGKYAHYVMDGPKAIQIREPDGIHLSRGGADRLAVALVEKLCVKTPGKKISESQP